MVWPMSPCAPLEHPRALRAAGTCLVLANSAVTLSGRRLVRRKQGFECNIFLPIHTRTRSPRLSKPRQGMAGMAWHGLLWCAPWLSFMSSHVKPHSPNWYTNNASNLVCKCILANGSGTMKEQGNFVIQF